MNFFATIFAALLLLMSAFGLGGFLRPLFPPAFSKIDRLAVIPLGGLGLQGLLLFLLGLLRFSPPVILGLLVPGALLGIRCLWQEARGVDLSANLATIPRIPAVVIALVLMVTILGGFAEPVGDNKIDATSYHYLGPKVWLRDAVVRPVLDESHTDFPATAEMQFAPLLLLGGDSAPEFFAVIAFLLMLPLVAAIAIRCGLSAEEAWWIAALISAMPAVYRGLFGGMIDVVYAGFLLTAARIAFDAEQPGEYALLGLFSGFALGTKYTALIGVPLLILCAIVFPPNSTTRFSPKRLVRFAFALVLAALIAAPWYLRNWIVLGCPIYPPTPFLTKIFPVRYFPLAAALHFQYLMRLSGQGLGHGPLQLLMLPFNLTFHAANFEGGAGGIGLVPLAFLPFCFRARHWDNLAKALALFGILSTLTWFYTFQESRYLIQVYLIAAIFGVAGWSHVVREGPRVARQLAAVTVAMSILYGLFMIVAGRVDDIRAGFSKSFAERQNHAEIPFLDSFRYLNNDPSVGRVLVLDPLVPVFYLNKDYLKPIGRRGEEPLPGITVPTQVLPSLSERKITHVLDVQWDKGGFQIPDPPKNLVLVFSEKNQRIYRVSPPG